jgi:hypothetical protein
VFVRGALVLFMLFVFVGGALALLTLFVFVGGALVLFTAPPIKTNNVSTI